MAMARTTMQTIPETDRWPHSCPPSPKSPRWRRLAIWSELHKTVASFFDISIHSTIFGGLIVPIQSSLMKNIDVVNNHFAHLFPSSSFSSRALNTFAKFTTILSSHLKQSIHPPTKVLLVTHPPRAWYISKLLTISRSSSFVDFFFVSLLILLLLLRRPKCSYLFILFSLSTFSLLFCQLFSHQCYNCSLLNLLELLIHICIIL